MAKALWRASRVQAGAIDINDASSRRRHNLKRAIGASTASGNHNREICARVGPDAGLDPAMRIALLLPASTSPR
jgi:hypothetical protein